AAAGHHRPRAGRPTLHRLGRRTDREPRLRNGQHGDGPARRSPRPRPDTHPRDARRRHRPLGGAAHLRARRRHRVERAAPLILVLFLSIPFFVMLARKPVLRRLALRNASRRPRETMLVLLGSLLGTAIITG